LAGIACYGEQYPGEALLADVTLKTAVPPSEARVYVNSRGVVTMFAMSETVRRVVVIAPRERLPECAERAWLQERLETAGCGGTQIGEVAWSNTFRVQRRVADAMRRGSVVLAGDSVHTHSPVGGQGMNVGLRDAWTLAEKLTQVLSNTATDALLDDYERERLPVARAVVRRTHLLTSVLAHPHPFLRVARERVGPAIAGLPLVYKPLIRRLALTA
jgi:2-polyprenyl-6-methoxyphenol hydroxylase-like FAD-dependent oxidoreductase